MRAGYQPPNAPLGAAHATTDELLALADFPPFGPAPDPAAKPRPIPKLQLDGARKNARNAAPMRTVPVAPMWHIDRCCLLLYSSLCPKQAELDSLNASFERVKAVLLDQFPDGSVHLFGSLANGLCISQSYDIDVTLHLDDFRNMDRDTKAELVQKLSETLEKEGMLEVKPLAGARVPVVKFVMPDATTKVDVTINNQLPLVNTRLTGCYAAIDERLKQLIYIVKHWAKRRQINDAYRGTLSSYAYVMLCIFVAQKCGLVPVLQQEQPFDVQTSVSINDDEWQCRFNADVARHRSKASEHVISIGGLLTMFFDYFAFRFDFNREVVCPRLGRALFKEDKEWVKKIGTERHLCCIEDPFLLSHDLGRTVDKATRGTLQQEFERAARIMYQLRDPLPELLKEFKLPESKPPDAKPS